MHLWDYLGGHEYKQTWQKAKCNVSVGLKQLKIAKWKVQLKEKKHECVKLNKAEDVPGAILPREKPQECTVKQLQRWLIFAAEPKQPERNRSSYKGTTRKFLKLFVHKKHNNLHVLS